MSNQTPTAAGHSGRLYHTPAPAPKFVLEPIETAAEIKCGACRREIPVTVTSTPRVESRHGQSVIRRRHTAPARAICPHCSAAFRLHLLEEPDGSITLTAGVKLAS